MEQRVMASNVYQCTACAREFKDKSQLTKHFNMEHSKVSRKYRLYPKEYGFLGMRPHFSYPTAIAKEQLVTTNRNFSIPGDSVN